jgi:hypothetical protein
MGHIKDREMYLYMITREKRMTYQYSFFIYSSLCEILFSFEQQHHTDCSKTHNYNVT